MIDRSYQVIDRSSRVIDMFADYSMIYRLIHLTPTNKQTHAVDICHHKVDDDIVYSAKMVVLVIFLFKSY